MEGLTINEAAETTGWSPRMLRYIESAGLIEPPRTTAGYRIFGAGELQRLRTLRELLARFDCALSDVAFAKRYAGDPDLRAALDRWFEERPERPAGVSSGDWLSWEQRKHERLLDLGSDRSGAGQPAPSRGSDRSGAGQPAPSRGSHRSGAGQPAPSRTTPPNLTETTAV
jgi:MerR family copper efflux transcriptional regulator